MDERIKATILVVEDDMHLMEGIHDILEINKYKVLTATNGVAGLDRLNEMPLPPDLIVSDIMMPRMDGYEFYKNVQADERWEQIPFIFLTAKGEREDIHLGKRMGVDDYVVKPFDADDLLVAVEAKLEKARRQRAIQGKEYDKLKSKILTILNHEFRTPLTYVVAYADMVHRDSSGMNNDELQVFLSGINTGANRIRRLVENFIMLVELVTGEAEKNLAYRRRAIDDYRAYMEQIEAKYRPYADEQGVEFVIEVDPDLPPLEGDSDYITAAVESLIDNGIKFSDRPEKFVGVYVFAEGDQICFSVVDKGRGIPASELERVKDIFAQFNREHYEDQGAGSGLAIADRVADLHGGTFSLQSEFGKGTEAVLRLPAVMPEHQDRI